MYTLRKPKAQFGPLWAVVFVPLLFVGAALSIPYSAIKNRRRTRQERRFASLMDLHGRTIPWNNFIAEVDARMGTLVVERFSFKGPVRRWWTSENVYDLCPYPLTDWLTMS